MRQSTRRDRDAVITVAVHADETHHGWCVYDDHPVRVDTFPQPQVATKRPARVGAYSGDEISCPSEPTNLDGLVGRLASRAFTVYAAGDRFPLLGVSLEVHCLADAVAAKYSDLH